MSLATNTQDLATRVATEIKAVRTLVNGNAADLSALSTTAKSNLVAAINELKTAVDNAASTGGAVIDDTATVTNETWSSSKINTAINAAISALVASSPATLDTLNELATALGDDPNFATTMTTALGNRLRVDAAQGLTAPQQQQGRDNLSVYSQAQIGDPTTDFVATFNAGLV